MGRVATGVRGMQLREDDELIAADWVADDEGEVLVVTDLGYAKRTLLLDYPLQGRGGKGVQTFEFKEGKRVKPNGSALVSALYCKEEMNIIALTSSGGQLEASSEKAPIEDRKSIGRILLPVEKNDVINTIFVKPNLSAQS
jgi:topoisomerase-4 subunit A